jgi:hypothetical protein
MGNCFCFREKRGLLSQQINPPIPYEIRYDTSPSIVISNPPDDVVKTFI